MRQIIMTQETEMHSEHFIYLLKDVSSLDLIAYLSAYPLTAKILSGVFTAGEYCKQEQYKHVNDMDCL